MSSLEAWPGQDCSETRKIAEMLEMDFMDSQARTHLITCIPCREALERAEESGERIVMLVRNIRRAISCVG